MAMRDEVAQAATPPPDRPDSLNWWQSRSPDELQAIVQRGAKAGDLFFAAIMETERRARDVEAARSSQEEATAREAEQGRRKLMLSVLVLALAAIVLMRVLGV
jgi:hypothetical protein